MVSKITGPILVWVNPGIIKSAQNDVVNDVVNALPRHAIDWHSLRAAMLDTLLVFDRFFL